MKNVPLGPDFAHIFIEFRQVKLRKSLKLLHHSHLGVQYFLNVSSTIYTTHINLPDNLNERKGIFFTYASESFPFSGILAWFALIIQTATIFAT